METAVLEEMINNSEVIDKIYDELEKLQESNQSIDEAYSHILETIVLDVLKLK